LTLIQHHHAVYQNIRINAQAVNNSAPKTLDQSHAVLFIIHHPHAFTFEWGVGGGGQPDIVFAHLEKSQFFGGTIIKLQCKCTRLTTGFWSKKSMRELGRVSSTLSSTFQKENNKFA
jgi:hypothetical protein